MTAIATTSTADGWTKDVFGNVLKAVPDNIRLLDYLPFESKNKLGQQLSEVVWLTGENGFTYNTGASQGFTLNESVVAEADELTLSGGEIVLRSQTAYKLLFSAVNAGKAAFGSYYKQKIANMRAAHMKRLEINAMHGGRSIGQLASISGTGTTRALVINADYWAPWIWNGAEGATLDAYTTTTKNNTGAITVTSVDYSTRTVNVSAASEANDLTPLETATTSKELYFEGSYGAEATGLIGAVSNSGTLYGISGSTYGLWAGNTVAVGSVNLTWDKIQDGIEAACGKGLDEDVILFVSLPTWSTLNSDIGALRRIDAGYSVSETDVGTRAIKYHSMNGGVTVVASGCCKGSEAFFFAEKEAGRVGSTDATFEIPGVEGGKIWRYVDGTTAVELQCYSDSAVVYRAPAKGCLFTGISNT